MSFYLPQPPRQWSRVQEPCDLSLFNYEYALLNKGNILQYKKNSLELTKKQLYSKLAKGQWVNRNTTWATQNQRGYTNPNNLNLQRNSAINVTLDTTTSTSSINQTLPETGEIGQSTFNSGTNLPVTTLPVVSLGNIIPIVEVPEEEEPIVIQDFGTLLCSRGRSEICNPSTDSDVPGSIQLLCWNNATQTWYPRKRYIMTNSGNKWPTNAVLNSAIFIPPPIITSIQTNNNNDVIIEWIQSKSCIPITNYILFQNNVEIQVLESTLLSITLNNLANGTYEYYIISLNQSVSSKPSNIVSISV
jgi:hypothetical protein